MDAERRSDGDDTQETPEQKKDAETALQEVDCECGGKGTLPDGVEGITTLASKTFYTMPKESALPDPDDFKQGDLLGIVTPGGFMLYKMVHSTSQGEHPPAPAWRYDGNISDGVFKKPFSVPAGSVVLPPDGPQLGTPRLHPIPMDDIVGEGSAKIPQPDATMELQAATKCEHEWGEVEAMSPGGFKRTCTKCDVFEMARSRNTFVEPWGVCPRWANRIITHTFSDGIPLSIAVLPRDAEMGPAALDDIDRGRYIGYVRRDDDAVVVYRITPGGAKLSVGVVPAKDAGKPPCEEHQWKDLNETSVHCVLCGAVSKKLDPVGERKRKESAKPKEDTIQGVGIPGVDVSPDGVVSFKPYAVGGGGSEEQQRWWSCPNCGVYIDAAIEKHKGSGIIEIAAPDRLICPNCDSTNLNTVEGGHFIEKTDDGRDIPKLKAKIMPLPAPDIPQMLMNGSAIIDETGVFPPDEFSEEPNWPRNLANVIAGVGILVAQRIDRLTKTLSNQQDNIIEALNLGLGTVDFDEGHDDQVDDQTDDEPVVAGSVVTVAEGVFTTVCSSGHRYAYVEDGEKNCPKCLKVLLEAAVKAGNRIIAEEGK